MQKTSVIVAAMNSNEATVRTIRMKASKICNCAKAGTPLNDVKSVYIWSSCAELVNIKDP